MYQFPQKILSTTDFNIYNNKTNNNNNNNNNVLFI